MSDSNVENRAVSPQQESGPRQSGRQQNPPDRYIGFNCHTRTVVEAPRLGGRRCSRLYYALEMYAVCSGMLFTMLYTLLCGMYWFTLYHITTHWVCHHAALCAAFYPSLC